MEPTFQHVLERLYYASGIDVSIVWWPDDRWDVVLRAERIDRSDRPPSVDIVFDKNSAFVGPPRPFVGDTALEEAAEWLIKTAIELYPDSDFAKEFGADAA